MSVSTNEAKSDNTKFAPIPFESSVHEEILGWWTGTITAIKDKTFMAELCDLEDRKSVMEMERRSVGEAQEGDIHLGARLVYSISRKEDLGGAKVEGQLQFLPPYLWSPGDDKYIEDRVKELYEDDSHYLKQ
jgi:hypothetical protein